MKKILSTVMVFTCVFSCIIALPSCTEARSRTSWDEGLFYYEVAEGVNVVVDKRGVPVEDYHIDGDGNITDAKGKIFIYAGKTEGLIEYYYAHPEVARELRQEECGTRFIDIVVSAFETACPGSDGVREETVTEKMHDRAEEYGCELDGFYTIFSGSEEVARGVIVTANGSQGGIQMAVAVGNDGSVIGIEIISNSETAGIGSKATNNEPNDDGVPFLDQYIGRDGVKVFAIGDNVDVISGATMTCRAITNGVNAAIAVCGVDGK